jgi:hypothetical protein
VDGYGLGDKCERTQVVMMLLFRFMWMVMDWVISVMMM